MRVSTFIGSIILIGSFGLEALACRDIGSEVRTYLDTLPAAAKSRDFVARVELVTVTTEKSKRVAKAKVLEKIKGDPKISALTIESEFHSCNRDPELEAGQKYYVAGKIEKDGRFRGLWKTTEVMK